MVMEVLQEDTSGQGSTQCLNHTFKNSSPGGICAFCLQEKLGKLVSSSSSSFPSTVFPSSGSSSSSPSFRSDNVSAIKSSESTAKHHVSQQPTRRPRFPFVLGQKTSKNHIDGLVVMGKMNFPTSSDAFNRSKSTTSASSRTAGMRFLDDEDKSKTPYYSPRRRGFWPFLLSSKHPINSRKAVDKHHNKDSIFAPTTPASSSVSREKKREELIAVIDDDDDEENSSTPYDRKVSRSRSVGCGSRSFSNDIFERISNGFGDCGASLRRVESHREGRSKTHTAARNSCVGMIGHDFIRERVRCGGIFSGFVHVSSSSPSSSSSYSSNVGGKLLTPSSASSHGRSKSWGWAFASPMRAFGKKSSDDNGKNGAPNLAAASPSILAVSD